jgi:membrane protease YdiL (CAAX protease family)
MPWPDFAGSWATPEIMLNKSTPIEKSQLRRHIGISALPVSVMPYMMIHFTKLLPEAAASIVAGFVLGYLAWKTKSIWGGVCVHCAVAATMDLLALAHKNQLPWLHG